MKARRLNNRCDVIDIKRIKNDEGKTVDVETIVNTIYCEVLKSSIKEFTNSRNASSPSGIDMRKTTLNLIVRYQQRIEIESDMKIGFKGHTYKVIVVEPNHQDQDYTMIGCEFYE